MAFRLFYFLPVFLFLLIISACGLKYTPQTTPEDKQLARQKAIENTIIEEFKEKKLNYISVAFGETTTIKPISFQYLDTLFERKYRLDQRGETDRFLDEEIARQRLICQNDTNEIMYKEEHVFILEDGSIATAYVGDFFANKHNKIKKVEFLESYEIPIKNIDLFKTYILGESFIYRGYAADERENNFYQIYKSRAQQLTGKEKNDFMKTALQIMEIAQQKKHLDTKKLLMELTKKAITERYKFFKNDDFTSMNEFTSGKDIAYYEILFVATVPVQQEVWEPRKFTIEFNPWLQIVKFEEEKFK
jgi:hypothetical protein